MLSVAATTATIRRPADMTTRLEKVILPDDLPSITKQYTGFSLSFNKVWHVPNYVAWELTADETYGETPRKSIFKPDNDIPGTPLLDDYRKSGFDRGHMAPAADMKWSADAMDDSHYLTNICPQDHSINGGCWSTLENNVANGHVETAQS